MRFLEFSYQTISDLQDLLDRLETFHRVIFNHFRPSHHNECRIASLVPVVEESYGMYKFVTSMLSAMHMMVESPDPLVLLVERYIQQFWSLKRFYEECSKIRYLTSLINIPKLPDVRCYFPCTSSPSMLCVCSNRRSSRPPLPRSSSQSRSAAPPSSAAHGPLRRWRRIRRASGHRTMTLPGRRPSSSSKIRIKSSTTTRRTAMSIHRHNSSRSSNSTCWLSSLHRLHTSSSRR